MSRPARALVTAFVSLLSLVAVASSAAAATPAELAEEVRAAETAFAASMAARDLEAFASHIADEALFFGGSGVLRGRAAVVAGWKPFFDGDEAPFSWAPESVEVLDSGTLGISSGPVLDPSGKRVGTFNSVWRLDPDGRWRVLFDKGCPPCACGEKP
jgi:ketosteroid isomerase-like protein